MAIMKRVKRTAKRNKKISGKKFQRGTVGNFFVFGVLALLMVLGITAVGGLPSQMAPQSGQVVRVVTPTPGQNYSNLQLKTFGYVTLAPTPTPPIGSLCNNPSVNTERGILVQYAPGPGQTTSNTGQVKVWVNDEYPPFISVGENTDAKGNVTPGATNQKDPDGFLWEPALYVDTFEELGGSPHFPNIIKGEFDNNPPDFSSGSWIKKVNYDTIPVGGGFPGGPNPNGPMPNLYTDEYIWNVSNLGLSSGSHQAEFIIHDGDHERAIGCVSITIQ